MAKIELFALPPLNSDFTIVDLPKIPTRSSNLPPANTTYSDKLKHPKWQKRRLEILNRDNFACTDCKSTDKTLHVHHRYYEKGLDIWDYPDNAFLSLCEDCHKAEEHLLKILEQTIGKQLRRSKFRANQLCSIISTLSSFSFDTPPEEMSSIITCSLENGKLRNKMVANYKSLSKKELPF